MKSAVKRILKSRAVREVACWLVAQYIRVVWATGRWHIENKNYIDELYDANEPFILCFWHGRLLMMPYAWHRPRPFHMLISAHRDGELIANTVKHHGISWVKGSSSKGGAQALRSLLKALKAGDCIGMTPDGPRGPRMRASDGIISVARMSGKPILPVTYSSAGGRVLSTWDRFLIPSLFTRGHLRFDAPIHIPRDADEAALEAARIALEGTMNGLTHTADTDAGRTPVDPAPEMWERAA